MLQGDNWDDVVGVPSAMNSWPRAGRPPHCQGASVTPRGSDDEVQAEVDQGRPNMSEAVLPGRRLENVLRELLACSVCRVQPASRRLRMELTISRAARDLRRSLHAPSLSPSERLITEGELLNAEQILSELQRHRRHTPFYKVVARTRREDEYLSVFDGYTRYKLGTASDKTSASSSRADLGGCFVHSSVEDAGLSVAAFPRTSIAWDLPRALLLVLGQGNFQLKHGKVLFDGILPLEELPWTSADAAALEHGTHDNGNDWFHALRRELPLHSQRTRWRM